MDRRLVASRMVSRKRRKRPSSGIQTTVPKIVLGSINQKTDRYVRFTRNGKYFDVDFSRTKSHGMITMSSIHGLPSFPTSLSNEIGIKDGDTLDWYLTAKPGSPIGIQVAKGRFQNTASIVPRQPRGKLRRRALMSKSVNMYEHNFYQTSIPASCFSILGVRNPKYVKWVKIDKYYNIVHCTTPDDDTRIVSFTTTKDGVEKYVLRPPATFRDDLYRGSGSRIMWYAATDGKGAWEIHVRPIPK